MTCYFTSYLSRYVFPCITSTVIFGPIYTGDGLSVWDELGQRTVVRLIIRLCMITGIQTDHPSRRTITVVRPLSHVAAIFAYIEIAVLRVLAFSGFSALCERFTVRFVKTSLHHRISMHKYISFFSPFELSLCQKKPRFCCGRAKCHDPRKNEVGR